VISSGRGAESTLLRLHSDLNLSKRDLRALEKGKLFEFQVKVSASKYSAEQRRLEILKVHLATFAVRTRMWSTLVLKNTTSEAIANAAKNPQDKRSMINS